MAHDWTDLLWECGSATYLNGELGDGSSGKEWKFYVDMVDCYLFYVWFLFLLCLHREKLYGKEIEKRPSVAIGGVGQAGEREN